MAEQEVLVERDYTIPLRDAYRVPRTKRANVAVRLVREFAARHMKVDLGKVFLSQGVNKLLWSMSREKPPRRINVRIKKVREDDEEYVEVILPKEVEEEAE